LKNNQSNRKRITSNTSFQTQLFLIILIVFAVFIVAEYFIVNYSFNGDYFKTKVTANNELLSTLSRDINTEKGKDEYDGSGNVQGTVEKFINETGAIVVFLSNESGGYILEDSGSNAFLVQVQYQDTIYNLKMPSYQIVVKVGDKITAECYLSTDSNSYIPLSLMVNGEISPLVNGSNNQETKINITSGQVVSITKPKNLNYLYEGNSKLEQGIIVLTNNQNLFTSTPSSSTSSKQAFYYYNEETSVLYSISQPKSFGDNELILVVFSMIETSSILSVISSYYGYIVLISIMIAILIALFISKAFSEPIKTLEQEMHKLSDGNYAPSYYRFKNREMVSLQETTNGIKKSTKEKVDSINSQKEDLEKLNQELLKEEELRSSFIARLSHELKTPLMVIGATTEAMQDGIIKPDEMEKQYDTILEEIDKTTGIIKDIIGTYKVSNSKTMTLNITRFNLTELVKDIIDPLYPIAEKNNLIVETHLEQIVYMNADKNLIAQVVSNFITNAFKYTSQNHKVEININDNASNFVFEVKNYGAHIAEENLSKIWLPFYRENVDIDKTSTGMGLYIVKEILNTHKIKYDVVNFDGGVEAFFVINK